MDKISGIIPNSARVSAVDMREAAPVRPGTPSFGRPEGISSLKEVQGPVVDTARRATAIQQNMNGWKSKDIAQAEMAKRVSDGFFMRNNRQSAGPVKDVDQPSSAPIFEAPVESKPTGFQREEKVSFFPAGDDADDAVTQLKQPEGLFPKGSFINRTA